MGIFREMMDAVDHTLSEERSEKIYVEIEKGCYDEWDAFLYEFEQVVEHEYSDEFMGCVNRIMRKIVDEGAYEQLMKLLQITIWPAKFDDEGYECIFTYCVRKIEDEDTLIQVFSYIEKGYDTNFLLGWQSPGCVAIEKKKYRLARFLWDRENCSEKKFCDAYTALQYAAKERRHDLACMLIDEWGHSVDMLGTIGYTPLTYAAINGDIPMIQLLIERGANVNLVSDNGQSVLEFCEVNEARQVLVSNGARPATEQEKLVCRCISELQCNGILQQNDRDQLLSYDTVLVENQEDNIVLLAATAGDVETLRALLPHCDVGEIQDKLIWETFSSYRVSEGLWTKSIGRIADLVDILLQNNVVAGTTREGFTNPLYWLASRGDAMRVTDEAICRQVLEDTMKLGCQLRCSRDRTYNTLYCAIHNLNKIMINFCIEQGMRYDEEELCEPHESIIEVLLRAQVWEREEKRAYVTVREILEEMLEAGCDINFINDEGDSILHRLVGLSEVDREAVQIAIEYGADLSAMDAAGLTPYDVVVTRKDCEDIADMMRRVMVSRGIIVADV